MTTVLPEYQTKVSTSSNSKKLDTKAEPSPEWYTAKELWGDAWTVHWIGFSIIFLLLAVAATVTLFRIRQTQRQCKTMRMLKFFKAMIVLLIILALCRALYLFINPYESDQCISGDLKYCPIIISRLLDSLVVPSITIAYLLLYIALVEALKIKGNRIKQLQKWKILLTIIGVSYAVSVTTSLVTTYYANVTIFISVCNGYFILMSVFLLIAALQGGLQIILRSRKSMQRLSSFHTSTKSQSYRGTPKAPRLKKVLIFTVTTTVLAVLWLGCQIYGLVAVNLEATDDGKVHPWRWYAYQTVYRITEVAMWCLLYYLVSSRRLSSNVERRSLTSKLSSLPWNTNSLRSPFPKTPLGLSPSKLALEKSNSSAM